MESELISSISEARELSARLVRAAEELKTAQRNHNKALYKYLQAAFGIKKQILAVTKAENVGSKEIRERIDQTFKVKNVRKVNSLGLYVVAITHPGLTSKTRSKYAAVLKYADDNKRGLMPVKKIVERGGGINKAVAKVSAKRKINRKPRTLADRASK